MFVVLEILAFFSISARADSFEKSFALFFIAMTFSRPLMTETSLVGYSKTMNKMRNPSFSLHRFPPSLNYEGEKKSETQQEAQKNSNNNVFSLIKNEEK